MLASSTLPVPYKSEPRDYQRCVETIWPQREIALIADMGLGKTKMAIDVAAAKHLNGLTHTVVVFAPNGVHTQWRDQAVEHCGVDNHTFVWNAQRSKSAWYRKEQEHALTVSEQKLLFVLINIEAMQSESVVDLLAQVYNRGPDNVLTIIDESTRIKNPRAKRTKRVHQLQNTGHRMIITGTPVTQSPFDIWSQYEFIHHHYFDCNYFMFKHRHGVIVKQEINGAKFQQLITPELYTRARQFLEKRAESTSGEQLGLDVGTIQAACYTFGLTEKGVKWIAAHADVQRYKHLDRIKEAIKPVSVVLRKEDCVDLPEKIYEERRVELSKEQARLYKQLRNQMLTEYGDAELTVENKISLTMRLLQIVGGNFPSDIGESQRITPNAKLNALVEEIEELNAERGTIVWAVFREEIRTIAEALNKGKYSFVQYHGGVAGSEKTRAIESFRNGDAQLFLATPQAASFGLNLQHADTQLWYSRNYYVEQRLQAEDRTHRIGQIRNCVYKDIIANCAVEEGIWRVLKEGKSLSDYFRDKPLEELV